MLAGDGVGSVPMVREAIDQRHWSEAEQGIVRTAKVVDAAAAVIDRAASQLETLGK